MPRKPPGAKAKGIGAELRRLRNHTGMSLEDAGKPMGLSKTIVSRLETGRRNISAEEVAGLLAVYGVIGEERDRLLAMARSADEPGWWEVGLPGLTKDSATLADYEATATEIIDWAPLLIPGLLQTMDYARAFMRIYGPPPQLIESRSMARLRRQQTIVRPDVTYTAYLGEAALHAAVGGRETMTAQLRALLEAERRSNVSVRVVPMTSGPHLGQLGGFLLLRFRAAPTVVHVELAASGVFHDQPLLTKPYLEAVDQLRKVALSATESRRLMADILGEKESTR